MAGRATLTTVASRATPADPRTAASRTHRPEGDPTRTCAPVVASAPMEPVTVPRAPSAPWAVGSGGHVALSPERSLGAVCHPDALEHVGQVRLHRLEADAQLVGDGLVGQPLRDQGQDLALP